MIPYCYERKCQCKSFWNAAWPLISRVKTDHTESPEVHRVRATTSRTYVCFMLPVCTARGASVPESAAMRNKSCGSRWFSRGQGPEGVACCRQFAVLWYGNDRLLAMLIQMISAMNIYVVIFTSMILCNVLGGYLYFFGKPLCLPSDDGFSRLYRNVSNHKNVKLM